MKFLKDVEVFEMLSSRSQLDNPKVNAIVSEVLANIKENGDEALAAYTKQFDGCDFQGAVTDEEIANAFEQVDKELIEIITEAKENIEKFHMNQKEKNWFNTSDDGTLLGMMVKPIETVGVYVPGGSAPLISSVLMNVVPAKVAGCENIVMATPPRKDGTVNPGVLVAAKIAGATKIIKMGGSQAIAALAYGTQTVPKVDKIYGPGNIFVATAKRMVFGQCGIDSFAGPSEVSVIADSTANPKFVAADLLSQAEHDPMASSILVSDSEELLKAVEKEVNLQLERLPRVDIARESIEKYGALVLVKDMNEAIAVVNQIAPEHLEICAENPVQYLGKIKNAGAIFLGNYSPEPVGDYFAGPNHTLPTSGTARFFSPLNVGDFVKKTSVISYSKEALEKNYKKIDKMAKAELLDAHARAVTIRFEG